MGSIPIAFFVVALYSSYCGEAFIGMNWGRQSAQRLVPSQVADLMLQNGIRNVRIYTTQIDIMTAFQGTGINLTITFFNNTMPAEQRYATEWFRWKQSYLRASDVRSLIIGGIYVFDQGAPGIPPIDYSMNALYFVQNAINQYDLGSQMSANFIHYAGILTRNFKRPSAAEFRPDIKDKMVLFLQFLRENHAPFLLEMFPIIDMERFRLSPAFAFPDNHSKPVAITDVNGAVYTNVFDWVYDCFVWALEKVNASDIKIVVSQVGWPTDGYAGANVANAERFYKYLLPMVASNKGTPKRPGAPVDVFINSLQDEPMMSFTRPFMRHWGIYRSNGEPKYKIDLSGQGRDIYPTTVKGIMRMPNRWCVFNGDKSDLKKIERQVKRACGKGDCTTLSPGASCSKLGFEKNVSYAFNGFFQSNFQNERACDFEGLAFVTDVDPSTLDCLFPVEVVKGQQVIDFDGAAALRGPNGVVLVMSLCVLGGLM